MSCGISRREVGRGQKAQHIKTKQRVPPSAESLKVIPWYQSVFTAGTTASGFLGAILVSVTISSSPASTPKVVLDLSAIGATLFLILFLLCLGVSLAFEFQKEDLARWRGSDNRCVKHGTNAGLAALSFLLQALPLAGTACLNLIIVQYAAAAGWVVLAVTAVLSAVALVAWVTPLVLYCREEQKNESSRDDTIGESMCGSALVGEAERLGSCPEVSAQRNGDI